MSTALAYRNTETAGATRAETDGQVTRMWLHDKSLNTIDAYSRDIARFLHFAGCSLADLRLEDLGAGPTPIDWMASRPLRGPVSSLQ